MMKEKTWKVNLMEQIDLSQKNISNLLFTGIQNFRKTTISPYNDKKNSKPVFLELGIPVI